MGSFSARDQFSHINWYLFFYGSFVLGVELPQMQGQKIRKRKTCREFMAMPFLCLLQIGSSFQCCTDLCKFLHSPSFFFFFFIQIWQVCWGKQQDHSFPLRCFGVIGLHLQNFNSICLSCAYQIHQKPPKSRFNL